MLQKMRSGVASAIFMGILVLATGGLVLTDAGGFFRGGLTSNTVARFGSEKMNIQNFDHQLRRYLQQSGMTPEQAYSLGVVDQFLNTEINRTLLDQYIYKLGLRANDEVVAKNLSGMLEPVVQQGITKKEGLKRILEAQGIDEHTFIEGMRIDIVRDYFTDAFSTLPVSTKLQKELAAVQSQSRVLKLASFNDSDVKIEQQPTDEDLQAYYETIKSSFATPAMRSGTIGYFSPETLTKNISVSDEDLINYYKENETRLKKPEKRKLQQALLDDVATAEKVAAAVKEGKTLAEAVEDVTKSKSAFLGEASYEKSILPAELAESVFTAKPGTLIGPVETPLGVYVVNLVDILPAKAPEVAELRKNHEIALKNDKAATQYYDMVADIETRLQGGESLNEIAKHFDMKLDRFADATPADVEAGKLKVTGFKAGASFLRTMIFPEEESGAYSVNALPDGSTVFVEVTKDVQAGFKPFETVKQQVADSWLAREKHAANIVKVQALVPQLEKGETSLDKVAAGKTRTVTIQRGKNDGLAEALRSRAFMMSSGEYAVVPDDKGVTLVKVESVTFNNTENARLDDIDSQRLQENWQLALIAHLRREAGVRVNQPLLQRAYGGNTTIQ
ncbi:MAG: hypothetical protein GC136_05985 [Alphaproteobacteria bacterium]|nr:hypothetical protein [Alphaproteobacteria bacterium]